MILPVDADTNITERARQWLTHPVVTDVESARLIAAGRCEALARMFRRMEDELTGTAGSIFTAPPASTVPE